ncbi:hypothetical protein CCR78_11015 [Rhodovulum imhoffii]|nr:hypothetical protein [Rhodovulum imhoffii]
MPLLAAPAFARVTDLSGPYLAARHASMQSDFRAAARYYDEALRADSANQRLLENAVMAHLGLGDLDRALPLARQLRASGARSSVMQMVLLADAAQREDYQGILDGLDAEQGVGPLVDQLSRAWALVGLGRMSQALEIFDAAAAETGLQSFGLYHKALALAMVGDLESADAILAGEAAGPVRPTRRGLLAHASILSLLERPEEAQEVLNQMFGSEADPGLVALRARLDAGETIPFDTVRTARDGIAEVFYTVASALSDNAMDSFTLMYARVAEYLAPQHADAKLMSAGLFEAQRQYDLAVEAYKSVPRDDPAFYAAELGRADALQRSGAEEEAIAVLQALAETYPNVPIVHVTLGDALRQKEMFDAASRAYDRAIELLPGREAGQWVVYYARGITHEREGRWDKAEADFRTALDLEPGQPQVLNYLGYSFVEMHRNLDEALAMIEQAVEARPNDGYITDSLGWVLYRLGRYEEAVSHMERAVELEPVDPIVNDHLGDVYWAVGRKREARFQWSRALSFEPEDPDAARIRRKLEIGLDAVLEDEGADPLHPQ